MTTRIARWFAGGALIALVALGLDVAPALAQDPRGGAEREIAAAEQQVQKLLEHAEKLAASGRAEEAQAARRKARQIRQRLEQTRQRLEQEHGREAEQHPARPRGDLEEILDGLERGMVALKRLHRTRELEMLQGVANQVRRELRARRRDAPRERRPERDQAARRLANEIEILKMALPALREGERRDAAELMQRAIRDREVALEGRRDEEAQEIRGRAPKPEQLVKILGMAVELWQEFGNQDKAEAIARHARELRARLRRGPGEARRTDAERAETEREAAQRQLALMRTALPALREKGRKDAVELLERAIRAREVALEGRRDEEAQRIRRAAPELGAQVEILALAAKLWQEFGHESKAAALERLAAKLRARLRRMRAPRAAPQREGEERTRIGAERRIAILKNAQATLSSAGDEKAAAVLKRAIQARLVGRRRGAEADIVRRRAPRPGQVGEALGLAARLLKRAGKTEWAMATADLARSLQLEGSARKRGSKF